MAASAIHAMEMFNAQNYTYFKQSGGGRSVRKHHYSHNPTFPQIKFAQLSLAPHTIIIPLNPTWEK